MEQAEVALNKFVCVFSRIEDTRLDRHKQYTLIEILFLTVSGIMSDCDTWEDIVDFGKMKLDWLQKYLPYENGIPSHDTLNRVMSLINPKLLETAFIDWLTMSIKLPDSSIISIDGKKISGSAGKMAQQTAHAKGGQSAKHMLHAWCNDLGLCIGQMEVDGKTNEITAIPEMLDVLDTAFLIEGAIISIDAIGCQKAITAKIIEKKAHFVIGAKDNQRKLKKDIESVFTRVGGEKQAELSNTTQEKGHSRNEERTCTILDAGELSEEIRADWPNIKSIVRVLSIRRETSKNVDQLEARYYISSLECTAERMNSFIRTHWNIENKLHWQLDVAFKEDDSKKQSRNTAVNYSCLLKVALNLLSKIIGTKKKYARPQKKVFIF
jgi:predicted transposase YbfD/YdcC